MVASFKGRPAVPKDLERETDRSQCQALPAQKRELAFVEPGSKLGPTGNSARKDTEPDAPKARAITEHDTKHNCFEYLQQGPDGPPFRSTGGCAGEERLAQTARDYLGKQPVFGASDLGATFC